MLSVELGWLHTIDTNQRSTKNRTNAEIAIDLVFFKAQVRTNQL